MGVLACALLATACAAPTTGGPGVVGATTMPVTSGPGVVGPTTTPGSDIPQDALSWALGQFAGEYGEVARVYGQASSTMAEWREVEPSNTSGLEVAPRESTELVYAVFVLGDFLVVGPIRAGSPQPKHSYTAGRIVFDSGGDALNVQLWGEQKEETPSFGSQLDA